jgi:hypothetical protein
LADAPQLIVRVIPTRKGKASLDDGLRRLENDFAGAALALRERVRDRQFVAKVAGQCIRLEAVRLTVYLRFAG